MVMSSAHLTLNYEAIWLGKKCVLPCKFLQGPLRGVYAQRMKQGK